MDRVKRSSMCFYLRCELKIHFAKHGLLFSTQFLIVMILLKQLFLSRLSCICPINLEMTTDLIKWRGSSFISWSKVQVISTFARKLQIFASLLNIIEEWNLIINFPMCSWDLSLIPIDWKVLVKISFGFGKIPYGLSCTYIDETFDQRSTIVKIEESKSDINFQG